MNPSPPSRVGPSTPGTVAAPSSGTRKALLGMAVLAVLLLGLCVRLVVSAGADEQTVVKPPAAVVAQPGSQVPPTPSAAPSVQSPDAAHVHNGRNPFRVLHAASTTGASAPSSAADAPGTPDLTPAAGVPQVSLPGGAERGQVPTAVPSTGAPTARRVLALLRIAGPRERLEAVFALDGDGQTVAVGESFGPSGDLLLLSLQEEPRPGEWTAVVQVGQGDPFDVVTGTPVPLP
jgi:hypothetical protein